MTQHARCLVNARSGLAQAPSVVKGEVAIGITFEFSFEHGSRRSFRSRPSRPARTRAFEPDPRIPSSAGVTLIKYDFENYRKAADRTRLIDRWTHEVESLARRSV